MHQVWSVLHLCGKRCSLRLRVFQSLVDTLNTSFWRRICRNRLVEFLLCCLSSNFHCFICGSKTIYLFLCNLGVLWVSKLSLLGCIWLKGWCYIAILRASLGWNFRIQASQFCSIRLNLLLRNIKQRILCLQRIRFVCSRLLCLQRRRLRSVNNCFLLSTICNQVAEFTLDIFLLRIIGIQLRSSFLQLDDFTVCLFVFAKSDLFCTNLFSLFVFLARVARLLTLTARWSASRRASGIINARDVGSYIQL